MQKHDRRAKATRIGNPELHAGKIDMHAVHSVLSEE
jgi:hypothetical protein